MVEVAECPIWFSLWKGPRHLNHGETVSFVISHLWVTSVLGSSFPSYRRDNVHIQSFSQEGCAKREVCWPHLVECS